MKMFRYDLVWDKELVSGFLNAKRMPLRRHEQVAVCVHPTEKPVALLEYLVKTYTNEGDVVLDNCMGSGSTGVACQNTNREFIGMELDEDYYKLACERIKKEV